MDYKKIFKKYKLKYLNAKKLYGGMNEGDGSSQCLQDEDLQNMYFQIDDLLNIEPTGAHPSSSQNFETQPTVVHTFAELEPAPSKSCEEDDPELDQLWKLYQLESKLASPPRSASLPPKL